MVVVTKTVSVIVIVAVVGVIFVGMMVVVIAMINVLTDVLTIIVPTTMMVAFIFFSEPKHNNLHSGVWSTAGGPATPESARSRFKSRELR